MSVMEVPADSYGLVVPEGWMGVPLDKEGFAHLGGQLKETLAATAGWNKTAERRLDLLLSQMRNDLLAGNVRVAAAFAESGGEGEGLLLAGVSVSKLSQADLGPADLVVTPDRLIAGLAAPKADDDGGQVHDIAPPAKVVLEHVGEAVCLRRLYEHRLSVLEVQRFYAQSYLVPHDGGKAICLVQLTTPNVEMASALEPLFEAIAQTLRIFGPGDATDFGESVDAVAGADG